MESKRELMEIALGHIVVVAGGGQPTRRLDWIIARAKTALQGEEFDHQYKPHPMRQKMIEMDELRTQCDELREMLGRLINSGATGSPEHFGEDIGRARAIVDQNWHQIKKYREKQKSRAANASNERGTTHGDVS